jgi:ABC-type amino acid transport substrate-binding protein
VDAFTALNAGQIQAVMLDTPIVLGAVKAKQIRDGEVVGQFKTGEQYGGWSTGTRRTWTPSTRSSRR